MPPSLSSRRREPTDPYPLIITKLLFDLHSAREDTVLPLRTPVQGLDGRELKNVPVPKGTNVIVGIAALNRDKALWGPDALEWKPERWLNPLPEAVVTARIPGVYSNMWAALGSSAALIATDIIWHPG